MTNDDQMQRPLDRRFLLRGGAVLAGAAGATVIGAALGPSAADAAVPPYLVTGTDNATTETTRLTIDGTDGGADAALSLENVSGPALHLAPVGEKYDGSLELGEIVHNGLSLDIGVDYYGAGAQTTWLATGLDMDQIPFTLPLVPERQLDTRDEHRRDNITSHSPNALDSSFRLKADAWLDVGIAPTEFTGLDAVFVNVTAVKPVKSGVLTAYPPGDRPVSSTLNFQQGQTIANGAFIMTGVARENPEWFVIRIHTTAATHLVVDLTGVVVRGMAGTTSTTKGASSQQKAAKANRMKRVFR